MSQPQQQRPGHGSVTLDRRLPDIPGTQAGFTETDQNYGRTIHFFNLGNGLPADYLIIPDEAWEMNLQN